MLAGFSSLCFADSGAAADFDATHLSGPTGTWVLYFIVSKVVELGDTLFLAALGKEVSFLHWVSAYSLPPSAKEPAANCKLGAPHEVQAAQGSRLFGAGNSSLALLVALLVV
jgi:hypothetical protein